MYLNIAKQNATIIYENLRKENRGKNTLTYSGDEKLKVQGFLGKAWERIVDCLTGGKASAARIQKVNEFVIETFYTLMREEKMNKSEIRIPASSKWFNRRGERTLKEVGNRFNKKVNDHPELFPGIDKLLEEERIKAKFKKLKEED